MSEYESMFERAQDKIEQASELSSITMENYRDSIIKALNSVEG